MDRDDQVATQLRKIAEGYKTLGEGLKGLSDLAIAKAQATENSEEVLALLSSEFCLGQMVQNSALYLWASKEMEKRADQWLAEQQ